MNDADLESRVRTTLAAVAAATPLDAADAAHPAPHRTTRSRRLARPLLAAAVATAVLLGAVAFASLTNDDGTTVNTPADPAAPTGTGLPNGFDPATANPVFSAEGDPDAVTNAYLKSRFPDYPNPAVASTRVELTAASAQFAWTTGGPAEGVVARGRILLRRMVDRWAVVAATTDDVDLAQVGYDGARVTGTVRTSNINSFTAKILTPSGKPVLHAPPEAFADGALTLDVPAKFQPVLVRVQLVGGTQLSISEVRLDPPPLAPHRDHGKCFESLRAEDPNDDPPQDFVDSACLAALQGAVFADGSAGDRTWELVATEEPTGRIVRLRGRDLAGGFSDMTPPGPTEPPDRLALMLVGCCTLGDYSLVAGAFDPKVTALRVTLPGGRTYQADTVADPAVGPNAPRYAVVAIPVSALTAPGGTVKAEVQMARGAWHEVEGQPRPPLVLALPQE